jgi:hypothetical protein
MREPSGNPEGFSYPLESFLQGTPETWILSHLTEAALIFSNNSEQKKVPAGSNHGYILD